jgi:Glu-tRNA(Gln) amidotransferase subunit E-like FAD-binding protein
MKAASIISILLLSSVVHAQYLPNITCVTVPMDIGTYIFHIKRNENDFTKLDVHTEQVISFNQDGRINREFIGSVVEQLPQKEQNARQSLMSTVGKIMLKANYAGRQLHLSDKKLRLECE